MSNEQLHGLAIRAGLSVHWIDANGRPQTVAPDVLCKVLDGLGYPAYSSLDIDTSLQRLTESDIQHSAPPLLTVDDGHALDLFTWFAPHTPFVLELEDGGTLNGELTDTVQLPAPGVVGYHLLLIDGQRLTIAVAPKTCFSMAMATETPTPRVWGLTVQLYSLRRQGDGGFGDTQALETFVRSAGERGADAVAISPMHAMFASDPHRYSPYSPSSRLFLNGLYASPGNILGERDVRMAIEQTDLTDELARLEGLPLVDWPAAAAAKWKLLHALYAGFSNGTHPMNEDFVSFCEKGGEALENHCRFEALQAQCVTRGMSTDWREWPQEFKNPQSRDIAEFADVHREQIRFHAFAQWLIARGLERAQVAARSSGMCVGLIADLAVGADGAGSQAWSRQDELLSALTVGAPPDILNRSGQSWGISAFSPDGLKRNGFRAFIEMLRANFAHAGGLRIDHVMGLQRLWVVPVGSPPSQGAYLNYPLDDMLRLLALESWRHKAVVLGEDLGTVPEGMHDKLSARAILGMRVLLFEQDNAHFKPILKWSDEALATTSTHDLPTLTGWWNELDIDWSRGLGLIDEDTECHARESRQREREGLRQALSQDWANFRDPLSETAQIVDASVRYLGHTRAPLVLLPMEDALGVEEQSNLPGTIDSHPNWRRRLSGDSATLLDDEHAARRLELLSQSRVQAAERDQ
ncbi:4-alpha-glucanotransferase [Pseudomonas sp. CCI3.2]|uniref:4-alpha-glucanotransferase n=1 Tax=unclassified Pseudomonas TaxID=196821 RepID=UPI002AC9E19D|nr:MULTISPECIES: 4-alpha-glucanotransferase [unclassified Pseudomonas]MEB0076165.1 4-alpha-glucanotransferase [Pseudomonas sp. MH10out]MEB0090660.1 4-alpha-glucanotransferase [Pseudomonas sp. CCI4.2]MEB0103797.1 4-alpha-glucanotransferase [Pseudomonas sp. CCI3.2]MEB0131835.1 4-alpha-glucanotransferase [Pseudomonas sp. CCI2.4]MEB0156082.1 4-alpha-glucanotransferase [Pseudomonas sp. AH2 (2023)]